MVPAARWGGKNDRLQKEGEAGGSGVGRARGRAGSEQSGGVDGVAALAGPEGSL